MPLAPMLWHSAETPNPGIHSVLAYFELLFLGCGLLIHLSNRSDSPRFRAPWKKIRQKYGTRQEPSLFKGHPLSCQYGEYFEFSFLGCGFLIHLSNRSDSPRFRAPWKKIHQKYDIQQDRLYSRAIHCPASMEMHYVKWFLLKSVYEITDCAKN